MTKARRLIIEGRGLAHCFYGVNLVEIWMLQQAMDAGSVATFVIKTRARKGRMAGGAVSFKIEILIQLVEGCHTRFVSPVALAHFAKKEVEEYPEKLPVYLKNAFLSGAYALTRG